jgi:hypothetical protein
MGTRPSPAAAHTFAAARWSQGLADWIRLHVNAFSAPKAITVRYTELAPDRFRNFWQ